MVINAEHPFLQNRRAEAIEWATAGRGGARQADAKDALAQAYKTLDMALKENGQAEKAVYSARALELYEELGDLRNQALILNNLGILAQERSSWDEALDSIGGRSRSWSGPAIVRTSSLAKYNIAEILSDQGRQDEAEALLREVHPGLAGAGRRRRRRRRAARARQGPGPSRASSRRRASSSSWRTPSRSALAGRERPSRRRCAWASSQCSPENGHGAHDANRAAIEDGRSDRGRVGLPARAPAAPWRGPHPGGGVDEGEGELRRRSKRAEPAATPTRRRCCST